jgi:hypothetical protein
VCVVDSFTFFALRALLHLDLGFGPSLRGGCSEVGDGRKSLPKAVRYYTRDIAQYIRG